MWVLTPARIDLEVFAKAVVEEVQPELSEKYIET